MNYSTDAVVQGIINYADREVMPKLPTSGKWVMGTAIGLATTKVTNVVETLKTNKIVTMLDVVDENGDIDVDAISTAMKSSAEKYGNVTMDVPFVGRLTFSAEDINRLRDYIG